MTPVAYSALINRLWPKFSTFLSLLRLVPSIQNSCSHVGFFGLFSPPCYVSIPEIGKCEGFLVTQHDILVAGPLAILRALYGSTTKSGAIASGPARIMCISLCYNCSKRLLDGASLVSHILSFEKSSSCAASNRGRHLAYFIPSVVAPLP